MKYLECEALNEINCLLGQFDAGNCVIYGKLELYTCDRSNEDLELSKEVQQRMKKISKTSTAHSWSEATSPKIRLLSSSAASSSVIATSPSSSFGASAKSPLSPFGNISTPSNRHVFCDLIAALNASFSDYDFVNVKPEDFSREKMEHVFNSINLSLRDVFDLEERNKFWMNLEKIISFGECEIFTYIPNEDDDPLALGDGKIWSWNYFFYNRKQKKVLFFCCHAKSKFSMEECNISDETDSDHDGFYSNPKNADVHYYPRDDYDDMEFDDV